MKTSAELRSLFLEFFREKEHTILPSASLIPVNDPTLLWINSGVATLKKYFDGSVVPDNPRLANSQKSIRTNDIENVGYTARHHTLFEMLGNFSIGEYFKEDAIKWAWEFLTDPKWIGFDPELLYVTYYPEDEETKVIWESIPNFDNSHLIPEEGNFWDIGAGPCGPNSEIFYDRGEAYNNLEEGDPENYPGGENERWLELWNLVFSQFNHMPDDTYEPLPNKNIDTGMGLERLVSVIQDSPTNFETDLFMPIIDKTASFTELESYEASGDLKVSFKVIADHVRAVTFAVSDGALPSNEGRGYILRRLIRRSVMHGRRLGIHHTFLHHLVPVVVEIMGSYYENLVEQADFVQTVILNEEERFHETIEGGENQLQEILDELKSANQDTIPGDKAFLLYDTFGFPYELTEEVAQENGFRVDLLGFKAEMEAQRQRARQARVKEDSMSVQTEVLQDIKDDFTFLGYDALTSQSKLLHIVKDGQLTDSLSEHQVGWLFFNQSPFYAEMGGQIADSGIIYSQGVQVAEVEDVQLAPNGQYMHKVATGDHPISQGQNYELRVDPSSRLKTNQNHTATHLLHQGLKTILGQHANQAGSYVGPDRLRFDFSHFGKVTPEEIQQVETYVNHMIQDAIKVDINEMGLEDAKALGAMALFGEKYGDEVRVVNIGGESIELCGGTHVKNTNDIGTFKLLSESGIGAGIRRIEALTGQAAIQYYQEQESLLHDIQEQLKVKQQDQVTHRIEQLQEELKQANSKIESLNRKLIQGEAGDLFKDVQEVDGITYIALSMEGQSMDELRTIGDEWRQGKKSNILVIASDQGDKANLLVFVDDQTVGKGIKAGDLIKPLAKQIGGGGGGKPQMAQAGGKNPQGIPGMLENVSQEIEKLI